MLRSLLVALDDTRGAKAARDFAIALSRRTGAALTAAVVLDRPHNQSEHEFVPLGGGAFKARRDAARVKRAEADAQEALAECAVAAGDHPYSELRLEEAPEPALLAAGAMHDLVVIGRDSTLGLEECEDGVAPVIQHLLMQGARPLVVVPPDVAPLEGPVLVAYDGTIPVMSALQLFALLGLAEGSAIRVACARDRRSEALELAEQGCVYLRKHGLAADPVALMGDKPANVLLAEAEAIGARMLVMGSFEGSSLRRLLTGSATHTMLRHARCPVFIHH